MRFCANCGKASPNVHNHSGTCSSICASIVTTRRAELHRFRDPDTLKPVSLPMLERAEAAAKHTIPVHVFGNAEASQSPRKSWWSRLLDWLVPPIDA